MDVDSRPVKNAGRDLDQLASKAERTERAANKLGDGSRRAGRGVQSLAREAQDAGRSVAGMDAAIGRAIGRLAGFAAGIIGVVGALRGMAAGLRAADEFKALDNRIRLVTDSAEEFAKVQTGLIDISRRTFASVEGTVQAYQRMAGATDRLGISQDRLLGIAETVNKAVALSGATSQAAEASLIQFGQALSNNFQASSQEINSLNEQVFALSDAIARGITKVTGIETFRSDLKRLAEDGKLSSELVIRALEAVKDETDATFNGLDRTFAQIAQRLKTNAQVIAKEAFGPLLNIKIDFATKLAAALEDPKTIAAATRFGATLADLARGVERNASAIGKAFQGIAAGAGVLAAVAAVQALRSAVLALGVAVTANPLGLLITGIAAAVAVIITFRDEITRALTPFASFNDLAKEVGPAVRGGFEIAKGAAIELREALSGLGAVIKDILDDLPKIEAVGTFGEGLISQTFRARKAAEGAVLGSLFDALAAVGRKAEEDDRRRAAAASRIQTNISNANRLGLGAGVDAEIEGVAGALNNASKMALEYEKNIRGAAKATQELGAKSAAPLGSVQKSLQASVADAKRLFEAAKGGQISLDAATRAIEIEHAAAAAVEKAAQAGEELSLAAATSLVTQARELQEGARAFIEAANQLKERARERASSIADSIKDRIGGFTDNVSAAPFASPFASQRRKAEIFFAEQLRALEDFVDTHSIGLNTEQLSELYEVLDRAREELGEQVEKSHKIGAGFMRAALAEGVPAIEVAAEGLSIGGDILAQIDDALEYFTNGVKKSFREILRGFSQAASGIGDSFKRAADFLGGRFGAALGKIGGVVSVVGEASGIVSSVIGIFKKLFGKPSDNAAGGQINFDTFKTVNSFSKNNDPETIAARDALLNETISLAKALSELTGSTLAGALSIQVGRRDGTVITSSAGGRVTTPVGDAQAALDEIFRQLVVSLRGGEKALVDYVKAAQAAKRAPDEVIEGLQALKNIFDLTKEPLSNVAQALKQIDDAVNPVIEDLKSLGQSIAGIQQIAKNAAKAVGEAFLKDVRNLNIDLQNSVFGQFNRLLEEIRQREADAQLLLGKGAITQQQFGFVQSTSGLQVSKFFEGLSDDDKESLADFLGLLKTASGDIAVARVKLEEQFNYLIDNVEETARNFEDAARTFERLAQNLTQTADAIRTEFSGLTPRDNTVTLQGRVQTLLGQARDETASTQSRQSALEALPQVVNALVQSARQAFGGTEQFASIRDFGLAALDEGATLADNLAKFNQQQADAAREDVKLLTDIRELINDDRQLPTLQAILDEGKLTNTLIAQQLQTFLNLMATAGSNLNQITAEQLQAAAAAYLAQQQQAISQASSSTQTASTQTTATPALSATTTDQQLAQALADQAAATDKNSAAILRMEQTIDDLATEIRRTTLRQVA